MRHFTPEPSPTPLSDTFFRLLAAYRSDVKQERIFVRLAHMSIAPMVTLGRHTVSHMLSSTGEGGRDWSAWYRLYTRQRLDLAAFQKRLVRQVVDVIPATEAVIVVGVDGTQFPRSSKTMPGSGLTVNPRCPKWQRGLHYAQRVVCMSLLFPRSAAGDSRAIPLKSLFLRSAKTTPIDDEPLRTESQAATELVTWLREELDTLDRTTQQLVVLGDGAYSNAGVLKGLPERTTLFARCAKNRALFALPEHREHGRGRQRKYGEHGPTPQETLHTTDDWHDHSFSVRGRGVTPIVKMTGPWLVKPAHEHPVMLVVVRGVDRGKGVTRRQRDPQYFLVSTRKNDEGTWELALPLSELLAWAWQRWEVEIMHKEIKSGFGVGDQQAFSEKGAATMIPWMLWVYALLILTGYKTWQLGVGTVPDLGCWWKPRRWSFAKLWQGMRQEIWQLGEFQPIWQRSPDNWLERTVWIGTQTNALAGYRRS